MGTRADFYVGKGENAEWLGSIAWDGYPTGITPNVRGGARGAWPEGGHLFAAATPEEFKARLAQYFEHREDVTLPERGWPWPWNTSSTTDYAYALDGGKVWASCFGGPWFDPMKERAVDEQEEDEEEAKGPKAVFPNMVDRKNVRFDGGSGLMILTMSERGSSEPAL